MGCLENMSMSGLADILKTDEDFWKNWNKVYESAATTVLILLFLFLLSNLFTFMIRIYNNSLPMVNINIVNTFNVYFVEILNIGVTIISVPTIWVALTSLLDFSFAYILGLTQAMLAYVLGVLACVVGILKVLLVLQVNIIMDLRLP